MAKGSHTSSILTGKDKRCYLTGETRGLEKHHIYFGTGSGKRRSWRGSEGQAYCMKRIKERAQR